MALVQEPAALPDWTAARNIAQVIQGAVVAAAAIAAFVWGLYVFRVGRNDAGQVHVHIDLTKVIDTLEGKVAVLSIRLKNTGRTRIERDRDKEVCSLSITPITGGIVSSHPHAQIAVSPDPHEKFIRASELKPRNDATSTSTVTASQSHGKPGAWPIFNTLIGLEPNEEAAEDALLRWGTFDDFLGNTPMFRVKVTFKGGSSRLWGRSKTKTWGSRRVVTIDDDAERTPERAQEADVVQRRLEKTNRTRSGQEIDDTAIENKPVEDRSSERIPDKVEILRAKDLSRQNLRNQDLMLRSSKAVHISS